MLLEDLKLLMRLYLIFRLALVFVMLISCVSGGLIKSSTLFFKALTKTVIDATATLNGKCHICEQFFLLFCHLFSPKLFFENHIVFINTETLIHNFSLSQHSLQHR